MSRLPLNSIRRFVNNSRVLRIAGTLLAALIIPSCEEYPTPYQPGLYPRAAPAGWWDDDGASGKPRIVVHIGEQKAYFYKGKTLVGETTVSTGKPGFSTPPGRYTVISKDAEHVSSVFGDYVDEYGNVVRSNIDSRKDTRPKGSHFDGARMPYAMFFRGGYAMHQGDIPPLVPPRGCFPFPGQMAVPVFVKAPRAPSVAVTE